MIGRYCLLSWAMCMSMVSIPLRNKLKGPEDFKSKELLTNAEYSKLRTKNDTDVWRKKWSVPILWANNLICEAEESAKINGDLVVIKESKEIINSLNKFLQELEHVLMFRENPTPHLILQAITIGAYCWFLFGLIASQGLMNVESGNTIAVCLVANFPGLSCLKYILIFGWLKTAKYLTNPFGEDR